MLTKSIAPVNSTLLPWLSVKDALRAIAFYKAAFGAIQAYYSEMPGGGVVARLSVNGAEFWVSSESTNKNDISTETIGGNTVRMILTVNDPDIIFDQALKAGATEIFPVGEAHGWRLRRLADPFGLHWEIGHPLPVK